MKAKLVKTNIPGLYNLFIETGEYLSDLTSMQVASIVRTRKLIIVGNGPGAWMG